MAEKEWVDLLRRQADVSAEEAERALDACNGDMLDAIIFLEREGAAVPPERGGEYRTQTGLGGTAQDSQVHSGQFDTRDGWQQERVRWEENREKERAGHGAPAREEVGGVVDKVKGWIKDGNENYLVIVSRQGRVVIRASINVMVLLAVFAYRPLCILALIALITGHHFRMDGPKFPNSSSKSGDGPA